jgi:hypothetical protein
MLRVLQPLQHPNFNVKQRRSPVHEKIESARLGASLPLHFQWYLEGGIGERILIPLDMYVMSEKAVGTDWKKRKIKTLRHATGCEAFAPLK